MFGPARYLADFARSAAGRDAPSRRRCLCGVMIALTVALLAPATSLARSGGAADATQSIRRLNNQRAANGIPAGIKVDKGLSSDCAAHDHYMALAHSLTHDEVAGRPGYSTGGAYAGRNAVLSEGAGWAAGNPYESAPLHLDQLLAPRLAVAGSADVEGFSCTTTFPGWTRGDPAALSVYTYPGPGAPIYAGEVAREQPFTPGDLVGVPQPRRSGPVLVVLVDAPGQAPADNPAALSQATLTGPQGTVAVKTVDGNTPLPDGGRLAPYISPGGFLIPVAPLTPGASYHAHVVVSFGPGQVVHDWTFTTVGADPHSTLQARGNTLEFRSQSPAPVRVLFTRAGGAHARPVQISPGHGAPLSLPPGSWQACGIQAASGRYVGYQGCLSLIVSGAPELSLGPPQVGAQQLSFPLRLSSVLRGRPAKLTVTPLTLLHCRPAGCQSVPARARVRWITLRGAPVRVALPAHGHGVLVTLETAAFQVRDAPYTAARTTFQWERR